jgi:hypothetical protein
MRIPFAASAAVEDEQVTKRHSETHLTSNATTDREGRFRFPYLRLLDEGVRPT